MTESARTMTAKEMADAIGVNAKAFRSFWRSFTESRGGTVGIDTPGSGARYIFENVTDEYVATMRDLYASHRRTNNAKVTDLSAIFGAPDASPDDATSDDEPVA